tara:strand:+ start:2540 stop:2974 length:435 start_codon:yes stop_codon:yes gene_type:complete
MFREKKFDVDIDTWIKSIQKQIPDMVVLGGYSRFKQGLENEYTKTWIDIQVYSVNRLNPLFDKGRLTWFDSEFQSSVIHRATWKSPEGYFLDIFIDETDRDFLVIDELNCQTVEEAIKFIEDYILEMGTNPYMESKRTKLLKYI